MNTYLKIALLAMSMVCFMLGALAYRSQNALARVKPYIVRIDEVGRAEVVDYDKFQYKPQEAENKYYLSRWAILYFQRDRYTIERDQTQALYFFNADVQRQVIQEEQKDKTIAQFISDSTLPYVDIEVKNIILDDLGQSPYRARIEFEKVFTSADDHAIQRKERWTASVTYAFADHVANDALKVNPLGLTIVRFRADEAFDDVDRRARSQGASDQ